MCFFYLLFFTYFYMLLKFTIRTSNHHRLWLGLRPHRRRLKSIVIAYPLPTSTSVCLIWPLIHISSYSIYSNHSSILFLLCHRLSITSDLPTWLHYFGGSLTSVYGHRLHSAMTDTSFLRQATTHKKNINLILALKLEGPEVFLHFS